MTTSPITTRRRGTRRAATALAVATALAMAAAGAASASQHGDRHGDHHHHGHHGAATHQLSQARAAAAHLRRVSQAEAAGYGRPPAGPLHECISNLSGPGAMGYHWVNGALAGDTTLQAGHPEVIVYEPLANGRLRLVALEYFVDAAAWESEHSSPPMLFGRELKRVGEPNRYEIPAFYQIHAWVGLHNPAGTFADFNPRSTCAFAS